MHVGNKKPAGGAGSLQSTCWNIHPHCTKSFEFQEPAHSNLPEIRAGHGSQSGAFGSRERPRHMRPSRKEEVASVPTQLELNFERHAG